MRRLYLFQNDHMDVTLDSTPTIIYKALRFNAVDTKKDFGIGITPGLRIHLTGPRFIGRIKA